MMMIYFDGLGFSCSVFSLIFNRNNKRARCRTCRCCSSLTSNFCWTRTTSSPAPATSHIPPATHTRTHAQQQQQEQQDFLKMQQLGLRGDVEVGKNVNQQQQQQQQQDNQQQQQQQQDFSPFMQWFPGNEHVYVVDTSAAAAVAADYWRQLNNPTTAHFTTSPRTFSSPLSLFSLQMFSFFYSSDYFLMTSLLYCPDSPAPSTGTFLPPPPTLYTEPFHLQVLTSHVLYTILFLLQRDVTITTESFHNIFNFLPSCLYDVITAF